MESSQIKSTIKRHKRAIRVRKRLRGDSARPRMCVLKTNAHIHVQLIDDEAGVTLGSISTCSKKFANTPYAKKNRESAKQVGIEIAKIAGEKNIQRVVLDRGASKYCGVIAALAESAREGGLVF